MPPTKRARPAFSPPRPRKKNGASTTKPSTTSKTNGTKSRAATAASKSKAKSKPAGKDDTRRRSRLVSPTPSASDSLGEENESANPDDDEDEDEEENDNDPTNPLSDSPEPDYILAEVTYSPPTSADNKDPPIPLGLVHRILHSQFSQPDKTKISVDAREVVGKYIEVFVREAIMRCAYEKNDGANTGKEAVGGGSGVGGGWLEVEDLEKVAVQLCLDF